MRRKLIYLGVLLLIISCDSTTKNMALGTLERDRIAHVATVNEIIVDLPVAPGSWVTKGIILAQLDDTQQQAHVAKAQAEVAQAAASLEKLRNGARKEELAAASARVAGAKANFIEAEAKYLRTKKLIQQNLVTPAEIDQAIATRDAKQASLLSEQERLRELTNGTRPEDLRYAEAHLNALQASLASEQKKLADLTITATRDGLLDNLPWNLGERVTTGSPLAIILAGNAPFARVYIPEPYRVKMVLNDTIIVHVDGLQESIRGTLRWISTDPAFSPYYALNQEERSRLVYLAEIQLPDKYANLPSGVPAQVELP